MEMVEVHVWDVMRTVWVLMEGDVISGILVVDSPATARILRIVL